MPDVENFKDILPDPVDRKVGPTTPWGGTYA
jgi:hypothetical protein